MNTIDGQGNNTQQTEILKTFALYANDDIHLGEKWIVSAGLRAEYFDQYAGRANRNFVFKANTDNHGWNFSPATPLRSAHRFPWPTKSLVMPNLKKVEPLKSVPNSPAIASLPQ